MQTTECQWLEQRCVSSAACVNEIGQEGQRNMKWLKPEEQQGRSSWTPEPPTAGHVHQCQKCLAPCNCWLQQLLQVTVFRVMPYKEKLCQLFISTVQLTYSYWSKQRDTAYSIQNSTTKTTRKTDPALNLKENPLKHFDIYCKHPCNKNFITES